MRTWHLKMRLFRYTIWLFPYKALTLLGARLKAAALAEPEWFLTFAPKEAK